MTKRKADIFTVAESVTNWFAASGYTVAPPEEVEGVVTNRLETSPEVRTPTIAIPPIVTEAVAGWAEINPHTWLLAIGPYDAASWSEIERVGREPADVAETGGIGVAIKPGPSSVAEVAEKEELDQHPFWSLLRAAIYEEW